VTRLVTPKLLNLVRQRGQTLPFPIEFDRHLYNTAALPCKYAMRYNNWVKFTRAKRQTYNVGDWPQYYY